MAPLIFQLIGRICFADGAPAADVTLAIVDADPLRDDLIALGQTGFDGRFRLSFTRAAFNQDALENEALPDLYLLCSLAGPDGLVPVHRANFPGRLFDTSPEDLGDTLLPLRAGDPLVRKGLVIAPQSTKLTRRTDLTDEVTEALHDRAAALVGPLLGVDNPLEGVSIHQTPDLESALLASFEQILGEIPSPEARPSLAPNSRPSATNRPSLAGEHPCLCSEDREALRHGLALGGLVALFDPFTKIIHIGKDAARQNLDALTVALARELVHAHQFARHPWLIDEYRGLLRDAWRDGVLFWRGQPASEPAALTSADALFGLLATIDGYAGYLERYYFRPHFNCALPLAHESALGTLFGRVWGFVDSVQARSSQKLFVRPSLRAFFSLGDRAAQEEAGLRAYRSRQIGGRPVPFDPALRPRLCSSLTLTPPLSRDEAREAAEKGDTLAQYELGRMLSDHPTTQPEALRWLRRAAEVGHREAQWLLASCLPHDSTGHEGSPSAGTDGLAWLQKAADQGLPQAQYDLARHLGGPAPDRPARASGNPDDRAHRGGPDPLDLARWLRWTERAAEQGFAPAQVTLGDAHDGGRGTPSNPTKALVWYLRAAAQGSAAACVRLAHFFLSGSSVTRDPERGAHWARLAAAQGDAYGHYLFSLCLLQGWGGERDEPRAIARLQQPGPLPYPLAAFALGLLSEQGRYPGASPEASPEAAADWYRRTASFHAPHAYNLALLLGRGAPGLLANKPVATALLREAALAGFVLAQQALASPEPFAAAPLSGFLFHEPRVLAGFAE